MRIQTRYILRYFSAFIFPPRFHSNFLAPFGLLLREEIGRSARVFCFALFLFL